ncbi:MAG: hypothetical protein QOG72_1773 [Sphingomonadales bacterium]|nr:hypothetical protein [Sphingomonadales bacterium]
MSERRHERIGEPDSMKRRTEWTRPEVDKLLTAGAESSDGADTDAADLLS